MNNKPKIKKISLKNTKFVCYIKNPFKLFVWMINKKFVQNVQFLESIKAMILKVLNKYNKRQTHAIWKFSDFSNQNK